MNEDYSILIVDDEESIRKTLSMIFRNKGYRTHTAQSGSEAIEIVKKEIINIALIDIQLPDVDGLELMNSLWGQYSDMDCIVITGHASMENSIQALNNGAVAYITKPFDMGDVLLKIDLIIERQQFLIEKRKSDEKISHLNAVLRGIRNVNQLITKEPDRNNMIQGSCDNLTETLGYELAFIILRNEDGSLQQINHPGFDGSSVSFLNYLERGGEIPCDTMAQDQMDLVVIHDLWKEWPECPIPSRFKNAGAYCKRLEFGDKIFGAITVTLPIKFIDDLEEQDLFTEVAGDISFALHKFELEDDREKREEQILQLSQRNEVILLSIPDIIMEVDENKIYTWANEMGLQFFGDDVIGKEASEYFIGDQEVYNIVQPLFNGDENVYYVESIQRRQDGQERLLGWWCRVLKDGDGNVTGALSTARDITETKQYEKRILESLQEKEILLKEIHHRVKNNLQIISSLLDLQADAIEDPKIADLFQMSRTRIKSMALIHETLYRSDDLSVINIGEYIWNIIDFHTSISAIPLDEITFNLDANDFNMNIDGAIPLGLVINELISNSLKHAFLDEQTGFPKGTISIEFTETDANTIQLVFSDDGSGMDDSIDLEDPSTLGLQLVTMLTQQLKGTVTLDRSGGTTYTIIFPKDRSAVED